MQARVTSHLVLQVKVRRGFQIIRYTKDEKGFKVAKGTFACLSLPELCDRCGFETFRDLACHVQGSRADLYRGEARVKPREKSQEVR